MKMTTDSNQLFDRKIDWQEKIPDGVQFYAYVDGDFCQLRMNDFPDESLYTLFWRDKKWISTIGEPYGKCPACGNSGR